MKNLSPFHLAIGVSDLNSSRKFYRDVLECPEGRSSKEWVDFDLFGHQLVLHEIKGSAKHKSDNLNPVDGHHVPIPHFGVILEWKTWARLAQKLKSKGIEFAIEPTIRFKGLPGEQATMFFKDPSGNALEFKSFKDPKNLFSKG